MPHAAPWPKQKTARQRRRQQNSRCVSIEPRIGHLKSDFRMGRNFLRLWMRRFAWLALILRSFLLGLLPSPVLLCPR